MELFSECLLELLLLMFSLLRSLSLSLREKAEVNLLILVPLRILLELRDAVCALEDCSGLYVELGIVEVT